MNAKQREIIVDLLKSLLDDSIAGDVATSYNNTRSAINDLCDTDHKLKAEIEEIEKDFENS